MSELQNNLATYLLIGLLGVAALGRFDFKQPAADAQVSSPAPLSSLSPTTPGVGRLVKINISVTSPEDLKVREGDTVSAGQLLADRDRERQRLESQKAQIQLALQKIEGTTLLSPPQPLPVPEVRELPPVTFTEEGAAISASQVALEQAQRNYELAMNTSAFITETAQLDMAKAKMEAAAREVELQQRKLDAIATFNNLPPEVTAHETEMLKRKMSHSEQVQAEYNYKAAELENAKEQRTARLKSLADEVGKAQANVKLAQSRLDTARNKRRYDEYQHSITKAQRVEESNQAAQSQARQQQEYSQQQRDREFQSAQLQTKLGEIDQQLNQLSTIKSPYAGTIRRIKNVGQNNQNLQFEITLIVGGGTTSPGSVPNPSFTSPIPNPSSTSPLPVPAPPPISTN